MSQHSTPHGNKIPLFERLQIESQSNCNRSCWFCPRTYDHSGKYLDKTGKSVLRQMSTEKILDLLDQAKAMGYQGPVGFHHYSEPLLDPRNLLLAKEARMRGMKPYLHTNGDLLKYDAALRKKVTGLYGYIVIGLYDYETDSELEEMKLFWQALFVDVNLMFSPIGLSGAGSAHSIGIPKALVPTDSRMAIPDFTYSNAPCHRPLIRMIIQHDGEIANCCEDTYGAFNLGNVNQISMEELWSSQHHIQVINDLTRGRREQYPLCQICPLAPTSSAPNGNKISMASRHYKLEAKLTTP